ncbi:MULTISPECIES: helix-turn-helix transcriptional regulator [unclassified Streptomyces]|uniref:helix-turn-helix transcriptional regulator n=1 Tax=unclassified Streptomyces TaxID=2593676 RepID=UPI00364217F9
MTRRFSLTSAHGYADLGRQYRDFYAAIGSCRDGGAAGARVYDLRPEAGVGSITVHELLHGVTLTLYDLTFHDELVLDFDLTSDYFELEYCVDGLMHLEERGTGTAVFGANELSISHSRACSGRLVRPAGQRYRGVSIAARRAATTAFFGSLGTAAWEESVEGMPAELRDAHYLGRQAPPELAAAFADLFTCVLPARFRALYLESKVMEILARIVADAGTAAGSPPPRVPAGQAPMAAYEIERIRRIPELLMENLHEQHTGESLARALGMTPKRLSHGFKQLYGDTIFSHHRNACLRRASMLLVETDLSVAAVALRSGYSSPSNFCFAFKRHFGQTPRQYRAGRAPAGAREAAV